MKDLALARLIPLAATGALLGISCGGRAIDDQSAEEPTGQQPNDSQDPRTVDVDNVDDFDEAFDAQLNRWCDGQLGCEYYSSELECRSALEEFSAYADLDDRDCRHDFLIALDCYNDNFECDTDRAFEACELVILEQAQSCGSDYDSRDYNY